MNLQDWLLFSVQRIGRWWDKNNEIDLLALSFDGKKVLLGECKIENSAVDIKDLLLIKQKAELIDANEKHFVMFSQQ